MRRHGRHALMVMVLGPAGAGKTTVCAELAARFALPHINVGDLLYKEVADGTPLGLEAKVYIEQSKTVLDKCVSTRAWQPGAGRRRRDGGAACVSGGEGEARAWALHAAHMALRLWVPREGAARGWGGKGVCAGERQ